MLYIWIDGTGQSLRCKTQTVYSIPEEPDDLPIWNFDGSSTGQSEGENSDVYLKPVALFNDPFRGAPNKMVLCETYSFDEQPGIRNKRNSCLKFMQRQEVEVCLLLLLYISNT